MKKRIIYLLIFLIIIVSIFLVFNLNKEKEIVYKLDLDKSQLQLVEGDSSIINASIIPKDDNKKIIWKSSNPDIVIVEDGVIRTLKEGVAIIYAQLENTNIRSQCVVEVAKKIIEVNNVLLEKSTLELFVGDKIKLNYEVHPIEATNKNVKWQSDNLNVITVNESGEITAVGVGNANVSISSSNGKKAICNIIVKEKIVPVERIDLSQVNLNLKVGDKVKLNATVYPSNATNKNVIWSSSNSSVVTVNELGEITAVGSGTVQVSVSITNENKKALCTINVKQSTNKIHFIRQVSDAADAILLESNGNYAMVDTGMDNVNDNNLVLNYLRSLGVKNLEFILITHNHDDHVGGINAILGSEIAVKKIYIKTYLCKDKNCGNYQRSLYNNLVSVANSKKIPISYIEKDFTDGKSIILNEMDIKLYNTIQQMSTNFINKSENYNSVVQYITINNYKTLLGSDSYSSGILNGIINKVGKVDVFKIPHHGYEACAMSYDTASILNSKYLVVTNTYNSVGINNGQNSCIKYFNKSTPIYYVNDMSKSLIVNYEDKGISIIKN